MIYTYYKDTLQKEQPKVIIFNTFEFIMSELTEQGKKVWEQVCPNKNIVITWNNSKGYSSIVISKE